MMKWWNTRKGVYLVENKYTKKQLFFRTKTEFDKWVASMPADDLEKEWINHGFIEYRR